jgi:AAA domain
MRQEIFDLSNNITLVYGANGTGKSSFCEALETAMLGSINEAQAKRIDLRTYCDNARLRRHVRPNLTSKLPTDEVRPVDPNEEAFRFCFVEKCRLDDFARIAARTPADQRQLIATLFGVDEFTEFVRGFNASLDETITLVGPKAQQLQLRRTQLATSEQIIAAHPGRVAALLEQNRQLAHRIAPGHTFQSCIDWLLGTEQQLGRLPWLQSQLNAAPPQVHGITQARLRDLLAHSYQMQAQSQEVEGQLQARMGEISYSKLYAAVLELAEGAAACPACGTGLELTAQNPFDRARAGLAQLAEVAALQARAETFRRELSESVRNLWEEIRRALAAQALVCPQQLQAANLPQLPPQHFGEWLGAWVDGGQRAWIALLNLAEEVERSDAAAREAHTQRAAFAQERDRLDGHRIEIERQNTLMDSANQEFARAQETVAVFEEANRDLIAEVAAEVHVIAHHRRIKDSYDGFLPELQAYAAALPARLLQGLALKARDLYNAFNRADHPGDLLHALWLPLAENGKIEVEFVGEPGVRYDALVVLSEGHIKCLGVAILVAKNISQNCSVIIFDDVVNAIDDDHRDGIWRTLFEDGHLEGKQIILTSHAEEFLHRIQQELGARRAGELKRYKFLPHEGEHELRVDGDPPTKNYVLLSQQALANDEKRDALRYARPALESLTDRIWRWLGRRADGRIELKISGPNAHWELNNKCLKLRSALDRIANQHPGVPEVVAALTQVLGNGNSIEWSYLNGAVHDAQRHHEFDRATVQTIVQSVQALDAALDAL